MQKIRVGVLRGGRGSDYAVSLASGKTVLGALSREKYQPVDIFIDRAGQWHMEGYPVTPEQAVRRVDVLWNALHGVYAAGDIQRTLDALSAPYTGSNALSAAVASHRLHARKRLADEGLRVPLSTSFDTASSDQKRVSELFRTFPHPTNVGPVWSSVKRAHVKTFAELEEAIAYYATEDPVVFLDAHVPGKQVSVAVVDGMRGDDAYAASPVDASGEVARLSPAEREEIWETARRAHRALGARHYSQSDFVVSPRGVYLIETKTAPALYSGAPLHKSLAGVGVPFPHFVDHVLDLSRGPRK